METAIAESYARRTINQSIEDARVDINSMIELCIKDEETGDDVIQQDIHIAIQEFIEYCLSHGIRKILIRIPFGTGKTTQVVAWLMSQIGKNHNLRTKIVCNTDDNAKKRVKFCQTNIEKNEDLHAVYPDLEPDKSISWGSFSLTVKRKVIGKDPSMEACGVLSSGTGSRADIIVFDDICDDKNTIQQPAMKEEVRRTFNSVWMRRLDGKKGIAIVIGTSWSQDDAVQGLVSNSQWASMTASISEDFSCFEVTYRNVPGMDEEETIQIPLWSHKYDKEYYEEAFEELGLKYYNLFYRNIATSEEDLWFPHFEDCINWDAKLEDVIPKDKTGEWRVDAYGGIDMSSRKRKGSVILTAFYDRKNDKRYVGCQTVLVGRWKGPRFLKMIVAEYKRWAWRLVNAEDNACQDLIVDFVREVKDEETGLPIKIPVRSFSTQGKNKSSLEIGIQTLDVEFSQDKWMFVGGDRKHKKKACRCDFCILVEQVKYAPQTTNNDALMALWFVSMILKKRRGSMKIRVIGR